MNNPLLREEASHIIQIVKRAKYIIIFVSFAAVVSMCTTTNTIASSGLVSTIGGATFIQGATHFWVSGTKPTFSGLTTAGSNVDITIGDIKNGVVADASGNWSYTPTVDLSGDNTITVATADTSTTFTLTIGELPADIASASGSTLSPAGTINPTLFILAGGISLLTIGALGLRRSS